DTSEPVPTEDGGSFLALQTRLFSTTCATAGCHNTVSRAGGLVLEEGAAYASLVNVRPQNTAAREAGYRLVKPGDPEHSFLLHKVEMGLESDGHSHGPDEHGAPMPYGNAPLTADQVRFIRQWIAAGAPRDRVVADTSLLRAAPEVLTPFEPLPPPAEGIQLRLNPFVTAPRGEREVFVYGKLNTADTVFVRRFDVRMRPGSHHFILYAQNAAGLTPGVVRDLGGLGLLEEMVHFNTRSFLVGSQTAENTVELPPDVVMPLPPGQGYDLNSHYVNHTAAPLTGEVYVNLHTTPRRPGLKYARVINDGVTDFVLPAGQRTTVSRTTRFNQTRRVFMLTSHTHKLGEAFKIYGVGGPLDGQLLYESTSWDHPLIKVFPTPLVFTAGTGYRMEVTYNNTTSRTVRFGLTSEDEMCIVFGYFYR
ncbi:MAG TPA: hypothetical protein VD948_03815, partial [Rhodothermales bacterium]|nr:hypothetical protein [Rhodothermales bacterium]